MSTNLVQNPRFDLTTQEGNKEATQWLQDSGFLLFSISPPLWLIYKVAKWFAASSKVTTEEQVDTARKLIEAGKANGVSEMRFEVCRDAGLSLGTSVEGVPLKATIGTSGRMLVEVKYKDTPSFPGSSV